MKVLFIISDTGLGHRTACQALIQEFKNKTIPGLQYKVIDLLEFSDVFIASQFPKLHFIMSQGGITLVAFNMLFTITRSKPGFNLITLPFRIQLSFKIKKITDLFAKEKPNLVVNINAYTNVIIQWAKLKNKFGFKYVNIITDLTNINYSWVIGNHDLCIVPNTMAYNDAIKYGTKNVKMLGYPIDRKYIFLRKNNKKLKAGSFSTLKVLIFGRNINKTVEVIKELLKKIPIKNITVVCGKDKQIFDYLQEHYPEIHSLGFTNDTHKYMADNDVIISKAGPGIIMEAIYLLRPLILTHHIGSQEKRNIDFVVNNKYGYYCKDKTAILNLLERIMKEGYKTVDNSFHYEYQTSNMVDHILKLVGVDN